MIFNVIAESMTDDSILIDVQDLGGGPIQVDDCVGLIEDERRLVKTVDYCRGPITLFADGSLGPHNGKSRRRYYFQCGLPASSRWRSTTSSLSADHCQLPSSARFSSRTFTPGSPRNPAHRGCVLALIEGTHGIRTKAASFGNAFDLNLGRSGADLGIKAAAGRSYHVDWNLRRRNTICLHNILGPLLDGIDKAFVGRAKVRTA